MPWGSWGLPEPKQKVQVNLRKIKLVSLAACAFRVHFKILLFVFKSLDELDPFYLSELLNPTSPAQVSSAQHLVAAIVVLKCFISEEVVLFEVALISEVNVYNVK